MKKFIEDIIVQVQEEITKIKKEINRGKKYKKRRCVLLIGMFISLFLFVIPMLIFLVTVLVTGKPSSYMLISMVSGVVLLFVFAYYAKPSNSKLFKTKRWFDTCKLNIRMSELTYQYSFLVCFIKDKETLRNKRQIDVIIKKEKDVLENYPVKNFSSNEKIIALITTVVMTAYGVIGNKTDNLAILIFFPILYLSLFGAIYACVTYIKDDKIKTKREKVKYYYDQLDYLLSQFQEGYTLEDINAMIKANKAERKEIEKEFLKKYGEYTG